MRYALVLSLVASILSAPVLASGMVVPTVQAESEQPACACSQDADSPRACCCGVSQAQSDQTVFTRACCHKTGGQQMSGSCSCPNCPCTQMVQVHFWSGADDAVSPSVLQTRVAVASDRLDEIRWEPRAPVPKLPA